MAAVQQHDGAVGRMRFAYADPPYLGSAAKHYGAAHPGAADFDRRSEHLRLIERLGAEYPDGWALSMSSVNLADLLPFCPVDCRVMAWVKPFASFKPNVGLAYTWEPVILSGGRRIQRTESTVKDHLIESITLQKGLAGAKPAAFCRWILDCLNVQPGDTVDDLFPGTGIMAQVLTEYLNPGQPTGPLFHAPTALQTAPTAT